MKLCGEGVNPVEVDDEGADPEIVNKRRHLGIIMQKLGKIYCNDTF